jgi:hypothetical protein
MYSGIPLGNGAQELVNGAFPSTRIAGGGHGFCADQVRLLAAAPTALVAEIRKCRRGKVVGFLLFMARTSNLVRLNIAQIIGRYDGPCQLVRIGRRTNLPCNCELRRTFEGSARFGGL